MPLNFVMTDMDDTDKFLLMEFEQRNEYARANFTLLVSWFTFFNTVNYVAIGWFISQVVAGTMKSIVPVVSVTIFFIGNNVLAVGACQALKKHFVETDDKIAELLGDIQSIRPQGVLMKATSPVPLTMYVRIIQLMMYTFLTLVVFWVSILVAAIYVSKL